MKHVKYDELETLVKRVTDNEQRVAKLGNWPAYIDVHQSLTGRVEPMLEHAVTGPGFDAGIACCLDLIPRDKQKLSATLHANYSPEAVEQARTEIALLLNGEAKDSETCWWLYACSLCSEEQYGVEVLQAVRKMETCGTGDNVRADTAIEEYNKMTARFKLVGGLPVAMQDGGMQGAYLAGHELAIQPMFGTWFVGTYHPSLGIPEDFEWGTETDKLDRPMSGPVHGSKNFVKCYDLGKLAMLIAIAQHHLGG